MCKNRQGDLLYILRIVQKVEKKKIFKKLLTEKENRCIIIHVDISKTDADALGSEGGLEKWKRNL